MFVSASIARLRARSRLVVSVWISTPLEVRLSGVTGTAGLELPRSHTGHWGV